jgi:hypothetical protein
VINAHSQGSLSLASLIPESKQLAQKHAPSFATSKPLSGGLVFGLMLSLAVDSETL